MTRCHSTCAIRDPPNRCAGEPRTAPAKMTSSGQAKSKNPGRETVGAFRRARVRSRSVVPPPLCPSTHRLHLSGSGKALKEGLSWRVPGHADRCREIQSLNCGTDSGCSCGLCSVVPPPQRRRAFTALRRRLAIALVSSAPGLHSLRLAFAVALPLRKRNSAFQWPHAIWLRSSTIAARPRRAG